jgi:HTH-type transcriptional regulator/antitoxin HigA
MRALSVNQARRLQFLKQKNNKQYMSKIENIEQYNWAVNRVEELLQVVNEDSVEYGGRKIELELLSGLVSDYSEENFNIGRPTLPEVMKLRMAQMNLTQGGLAKLIGVSPSRVSEYLTGKCEPTLKIGREICSKLNISPEIVLGV